MLGFTPYRCYYYLWKYITPTLLLVLMFASFVQMVMTPATYNAWIQEEVSKHLGLPSLQGSVELLGLVTNLEQVKSK